MIIVGNSTDRAEEHYLDALEAQDNKDPEGALSSARQTVKLNPNHAEANYEYGLSLATNKRILMIWVVGL